MTDAAQKHCIVVGLGNPGKKYAMTRHNLGNLVVQCYANNLGIPFKEEKRLLVQVAKTKIGDQTLHLVLPTTYMNESGRAIQQYLSFYKAPPSSLLVVVDDTALPFGQMRLRMSGSSGGHNGLKNIRKSLGTEEYPRLRMGIGQAPAHYKLEDYVLSGFKNDEMSQLTQFIQNGMEVVEKYNRNDPETVMNQVNPQANKKPKREESQEKKNDTT